MNTHDLEAKCRELHQLQSLIAEAQAEAETIKDEIKATMGDSEELRAGEYLVTWRPIKSTRMDAVALRKDLPDVAARFMVEATTRRFCVA